MSDAPETLDDAITALRRYADLGCADRTDIYAYCDRIEAAVKREMDEAAEFIDDYLREIPVYRPPHDWLIRNGYKDTSYQNDIFEDDEHLGGAPAPDGAERVANGDTK